MDCRDLLSVAVTKYKNRRGAHRRLLFLASCKLSAKTIMPAGATAPLHFGRNALYPLASTAIRRFRLPRRPWRPCTRHYRFPTIGPAEPILATMASLGYDGFATRVRDAHPNESAQSLESYRDRPSAGPPKSRGFRTEAVGMSFSGHLGFRPSSEARLSIDSTSNEALWPHQHGWLPWMACLITINARKHEDPIFQ